MSRFFARFALIFLLVILVLQPYNWFCNYTNRCNAIGLQSFIHKKEVGEPFSVNFVVKNGNADLSLTAEQDSLKTVFNRRNKMVFYAQNLSNKSLSFQPKMIVDPTSITKNIKLYKCLCSEVHELQAGETKKFDVEFMVDEKAMDDYLIFYNGRSITLTYEIKGDKRSSEPLL